MKPDQYTATCWGCGNLFTIKDGRRWKFLCSKCYTLFYTGLGVQTRPLDLKHNWKNEMRTLCNTRWKHLPVTVRENMVRTGIVLNPLQS